MMFCWCDLHERRKCSVVRKYTIVTGTSYMVVFMCTMKPREDANGVEMKMHAKGIEPTRKFLNTVQVVVGTLLINCKINGMPWFHTVGKMSGCWFDCESW